MSSDDAHERVPLQAGRALVGRAHPLRQCILVSFAVSMIVITTSFFAVGISTRRPMLGPLFIVSCLPSFLIIFVAYRRSSTAEGMEDPEDPEHYFETDKIPIEVLIIGFTAGICSTFPIAFLGVGTTALMGQLAGGSLTFLELCLYLAVEIYVFVALFEEGAKLFVARYSIDRKSLAPYIQHPFGVVLYAMVCALGFACIENVLYVMQEGGEEASWHVAIARALLSVPLHATTGTLIGCNLARRVFLAERKWSFARILALPVLIHGTFDYLFVMPLRSGPFREENKSHELMNADNTLDIGDFYGFLYLFNVVLVIVSAGFVKRSVDRMLLDHRHAVATGGSSARAH